MLGFAESRIQEGGGGDSFVMEIYVASTSTWFQIKFDYRTGHEPFDFILDWGDGTTASHSGTASSTALNKKYSSVGTKYITITGTCSNFNFYLLPTPASWVRGVVSWGNIRLSNMGRCFIGCTNLYYLPDDLCVSEDAAVSYSYDPYRQTHSLSRIIVPSNLTNMQYGWFNECNSLQEIVISEGITNITHSILYCPMLTSITLPSSLATMSGTAISQNSTLAEIISLATTPPTISGTTALWQLPALTAIRVPSGSIAAYKAANIWKNHASKIVAI